MAHVPLSWMKTGSRSSHATQEEILDFGKQLDWKVLFEEIEERYKRGYRDPVGTSKILERREAKL